MRKNHVVIMALVAIMVNVFVMTITMDLIVAVSAVSYVASLLIKEYDEVGQLMCFFPFF